MEDLRNRYNHLTDLRPFPKIAELIGYYTAAFSNAELALWQVYGVVLGVDGMEAMILLGELQSFSTKLIRPAHGPPRFQDRQMRADGEDGAQTSAAEARP
jgi:hypothetical protein